MREIKIIPLILSIVGLILTGVVIGCSVNNFEVVALSLYFILVFTIVLLLSFGLFSGEKNKFVW